MCSSDLPILTKYMVIATVIAIVGLVRITRASTTWPMVKNTKTTAAPASAPISPDDPLATWPPMPQRAATAAVGIAADTTMDGLFTRPLCQRGEGGLRTKTNSAIPEIPTNATVAHMGTTATEIAPNASTALKVDMMSTARCWV